MEAERQSLLSTFQEVTGLVDVDQCTTILEHHGWDASRAIEAVLSGADPAPAPPPPSSSSAAAAGGGASAASAAAAAAFPAAAAAAAARDGVGGGGAGAGSGAGSGASRLPGATLVGSLLDTVLGPLRRIVNGSEAGMAAGEDAAAAAAKSAAALHAEIDSHGASAAELEEIRWLEADFGAATRHASLEARFLAVYLHSPDHADTPRFCRDVLRAANVRRFLGEHCVCWAGSVARPEPFGVGHKLRACAFPFVALLGCTGSTSAPHLTVVERVEGADACDPRALTARLHAAAAANAPLLRRWQQQRQSREADEQLRAEQDQAYREQVDADRERVRGAERARAEAAAAAEEARAAAEEQEALALSASLDREQALQRKRERLAEEPAAGPGVAQLMVKLPSGKRLERRFRQADSLRAVRDWVDVQAADQALGFARYALGTSYPRRTYGDADAELTLDEAGLCPRAALLLTDLDA